MSFKFEKLDVWRMALEYIDLIYSIAQQLPRSEDFNLKAQITRAATSIALNIAEGSTGQTDAEQARFLGLALRSPVPPRMQPTERRPAPRPEFPRRYPLQQSEPRGRPSRWHRTQLGPAPPGLHRVQPRGSPMTGEQSPNGSQGEPPGGQPG